MVYIFSYFHVHSSSSLGFFVSNNYFQTKKSFKRLQTAGTFPRQEDFSICNTCSCFVCYTNIWIIERNWKFHQWSQLFHLKGWDRINYLFYGKSQKNKTKEKSRISISFESGPLITCSLYPKDSKVKTNVGWNKHVT